MQNSASTLPHKPISTTRLDHDHHSFGVHGKQTLPPGICSTEPPARYRWHLEDTNLIIFLPSPAFDYCVCSCSSDTMVYPRFLAVGFSPMVFFDNFQSG